MDYSFLRSVVPVSILLLVLASNKAVAQQDSTSTDSISVEDIRKQLMEAETDHSANNTNQQGTAVRATSTNRNPNISAIGDLRSLYTSEGDRNWDAYVQGVELNFSSAIDPYATA